MSHRMRLLYLTLAILLLVAAVQVTSLLIEGKPVVNVEDSGAGGCPTKVSRPALRCEINKIRRDHGLSPLHVDNKLRNAARAHAADMVARHYFSHTGPGGAGPEDRIRVAGYTRGARQWKVGETIAYGTGRQGTPRAIVKAWMNSPPHRAIILTPDFEDGGAGIVRGSPNGPAGVTYVLNVGERRGSPR